MLEAKDLPKCNMSDFLEARLKSALEAERAARAAKEGKSPEEVVSVEGTLTIRIINSITKKCEVKSKFLETFGQADGYPNEFPYRQRVCI